MKLKCKKIPACLQAGKIISNKKIKDSYFEIIIEAPEIAKSAQPGQFVNIKVSDGLEPLLRRPLSIHKISQKSTGKKVIAMLYEVVGKGTQMLSQKKAGEYLDVIGPLGNGFDYRLPITDYRLPILVAGGMGTAPLVFLAERLAYSIERIADRKNKKFKQSTKVLIGAKTKDGILCEKEFKELGCEVKIATDDGSRGFKGYVSELLKDELSALAHPLSAIYACGPAPMLKEISRLSCEYNIPAQISLEAHMACGIGACMGCVIKVKTDGGQRNTEYEYTRVCKDGPVFEAGRVVWD